MIVWQYNRINNKQKSPKSGDSQDKIDKEYSDSFRQLSLYSKSVYSSTNRGEYK